MNNKDSDKKKQRPAQAGLFNSRVTWLFRYCWIDVESPVMREDDKSRFCTGRLLHMSDFGVINRDIGGAPAFAVECSRGLF